MALTVLAVLLGGGFVLRGRSTDAPGDRGRPSVLRLDDYRPPATGNQTDNLIRLQADLPDGPANAAVQWLTPPDRATVERLATALGLRGHRSSAGDATTYTTDSASLRVQQGPGGQWQYERTALTAGIPGCARPPTLPPAGAADDPRLTLRCDVASPLGGDTTATGPASRASGPMSRLTITTPAAARAAARPVLEAVGIDPGSDAVRDGPGSVVADPTVGDQPTHGRATTVRVAGTRVSSAAGWLGGTRRGDTYPVISARTAWHQLTRTALPRPLMACPMPQPQGIDPMICGGPLIVTGARFGLSLHEQGGQPLLVPSWLFDVRGSTNALAVVAVDPRYLAAPVAPTGGVSKPGSGGSGGSGGSTGTVVPPVAPSAGAPGASLPGAAPPPESRFSSVTESGGGLMVSFTGGVRACFSYTVVAAETGSQVALSLTEKVSANGKCIEMAQVYERRVPLAKPLGARQVVDARTDAVLLPAPR